MIRHVGIDVHKKVAEVCVVGPEGQVLQRQRIACTREGLTGFASTTLCGKDRVALEATTNTWAVAGLLAPYCGEVVVSNPMRTRAIAESRVKTDKVDAEVLAQLLRTGFLPRVWSPDEKTTLLRQLTSRRAGLVAERTAVKNRIHAVLHQRLLLGPVEGLFSKRGRQWLEELELDPAGRAAVDSELRLLSGVQEEIDRLDEVLAQHAYRDRSVRLLMTLPGVDVTVALTVLAALGDICRFRSGDHAASYLGLVPRTKQSADHCYHGPITKQGNAHARWMLVQAAQHLGKHPGPLGVFFRRLAHRKNRNVAVVATARKLVVIAYHMLLLREPYRYAQARTTEGKLSRLRVRATGKRRRSGPVKGSQPRAGAPARRRPSLGEVYGKEGIRAQPLDLLPPGELKMLEATGLSRFADSRGLTLANLLGSSSQAKSSKVYRLRGHAKQGG